MLIIYNKNFNNVQLFIKYYWMMYSFISLCANLKRTFKNMKMLSRKKKFFVTNKIVLHNQEGNTKYFPLSTASLLSRKYAWLITKTGNQWV